VPDDRATRGLPERWVLPPPPREPDAAARWAELPLATRRSLAATRPGELDALPAEDREVVAGLARARLATAWRALATAPLMGVIVLMTVWGFGRSTYPDVERAWLLAGAALGAVTWMVVALRVNGRLRRARELVREADAPTT
jgi:hypothetical protein